ncbi:MAG: archease [Planctomycetota bacterium]|nr:archease [Planctomycetota bacterium]
MYEVFEHTADVGLRVRAGDLKGLFAEAGRGLFSLLVENLDVVRPVAEMSFKVEAGDLEDLLHDWLGELLYAFESKKLVLVEFEVKIEGLKLWAKGSGEKLDERKHQLGQEIKAITYHGLVVRREAEGWMAEVIVDL